MLTIENGVPLLLTGLECGLRTCASCRLPNDAHTTDEGLRCPENTEIQDLKQVVDDMGLPPTQCLSCAHLCERSEGCPVLTCVCGTKFCYICGQQAGEDERRDCGCQDVAAGWNEVGEQSEEDEDGDDDEWAQAGQPLIRPPRPLQYSEVGDLEEETHDLLDHGEALVNASRTLIDDGAVQEHANQLLGFGGEQNVNAEGQQENNHVGNITTEAGIAAAEATDRNTGRADEPVNFVAEHRAIHDNIQEILTRYQDARRALVETNMAYWDMINNEITRQLDLRATLEARAQDPVQIRGQGRVRGRGGFFGGIDPAPGVANELRDGLHWDGHGVGHRLGEDGDEPPARGGHGG